MSKQVVLPSIKEESTRTAVNINSRDLSRTNPDFVTKHNIKRITTWFKTWHQWQQRIFICKIIEHCLKQHLEFLATSLEPVLHFDFSSSLTPHLQSLHLDGVATFQVQRTVMQSVINPQVLETTDSMSYLHSLPSTLRTTTTDVSSESINNKEHSRSIISGNKSSRKLILPGISRETTSGTSNHTIKSNKSSKSFPSKTSKTHISESQTSALSSHHVDKIGSKVKTARERDVILPVLPLTHTHHTQNLSSSYAASFEDVVALRKTRFSSVPDFKSTTDLLKGIKEKRILKPSNKKGPGRLHRKSKSFGAYPVSLKTLKDEDRHIEQYKAQLALISNWLEKWTPSQKSYLLLDVVKLCSKELLGYFVQCLYQRLQDEVSINSLSDAIILKIFAYLDPHSLSTCALVCKRWYHLSNDGGLWRHHCKLLGEREGVGDLASAVETVTTAQSASDLPITVSDVVHESAGTTTEIDWKRAYWELNRVMTRIKELVMMAAKAAEERERAEQLMSTPPPTSSMIRSNLSLQEMLQLLRSRSQSPGSSTTQELLRSAPESAAARRRRLRAEKKLAVENALKEKEEHMGSDKYKHWRPNDHRGSSRISPLFGSVSKCPRTPSSLGRAQMDDITEVEEWSKKVDIIELISEAIDKRPAVPYLPDPSGVQCLILAGCLLSDQTPRPGRIQPIPKLRRLKLQHHSSVLCLQFDAKKIIMGTEDREILIHDIRSGRHVHTLTGHKGSVQCLQFDSNKVVSGSWDTSIIVWDIVHHTVIRELKGHVDCVSCLQFDNEKLVSGSHDRSLRVWNTSTWNCSAIIGSAHEGAITSVKVNKYCIASGSMDKCVKLWSPTSYHCMATLEHSAPLTSLLLSDLLLISSTSDGTVCLWNLHSQLMLMQWTVPGNAYFTDMTSGMSRVYGAGSDGVLYEWDISTGNCVRTLTGHSRAISCVNVDDNRLLVTAAEDHTVCLWYSKRTDSRDEDEEDLIEGNEHFEELPIRVITQLNMD